ncbi:MAG TPA: ribosome biogenesis GTP-binding protein YihA/YsxC [Bacillota bacterium]|nr:ribosome biogenesis GTP-binding protein YihA/YsxC [Bacillota bacterium]
MRVREAELAAAAFSPKEFPAERLPEIAFLGRSNVGKSSLINRLLGRKNLARTSSTPGKTRGLFFYCIDNSFYFVDLPGYGYAKVSKDTRGSWAPLIEEYLGGRATLCGCIHLVDCRHKPSAEDLQMARWLRFHQVPTITVAAKTDKLSRGAMLNRLKQLRHELDLAGTDALFPFSAVSGKGCDLIWKGIKGMLEEGERRQHTGNRRKDSEFSMPGDQE